MEAARRRWKVVVTPPSPDCAAGASSVHCVGHTDVEGSDDESGCRLPEFDPPAEMDVAGEASTTMLRAIADGMLDPQAVFEAVRDPEGRVVDLIVRSVNRVGCTFVGKPRQDLLDRSASAAFPNLRGVMTRIAQCLNDVRHFDVRAAQAGVDLIVFTWRDVTERFRYLEQLATSEERYRLLIENAGDVVCHVRDDKIVWVTPNVEAVQGAPPEDWVGREVSEIVVAEDAEAHAARWKTLSEGGTVKQAVRMKFSPGGAPHWVHVHIKPYYDAQGRRDGSIAAIRLIDDEVTALEKLEAALRHEARSDARYRQSMKHAAIGMCLVTPEGRFEEVNDALCRYFGYDAETLMQMTWQELTAPEDLNADLSLVNDILDGRIDSYRLIKQYIHADGHRIWGDLAVSCVRDEDGRVENLISQVTDITAAVEVDERNRTLARQLQQKTDQMTAELQSAAAYMTSIMPSGLTGNVTVSSRYLPSRELGGDSFDYVWIDDDHLLIYLIDVSGHGIAPALLSVSLHNMLRSRTLTPANPLAPETVLTELNRRFQMDRQDDHYFTMWYGVYEASTRTLRYAGAGAPPALAFNSIDGDTVEVTDLPPTAAPIGMFEDTVFTSHTYAVPPAGCSAGPGPVPRCAPAAPKPGGCPPWRPSRRCSRRPSPPAGRSACPPCRPRSQPRRTAGSAGRSG